MQYSSTLLAVSDMEASKRFYQEVLGLVVTADFGTNVTLSGGISLQTLDIWKSFIGTDAVVLPHNAGELYWEEADMDAFYAHLQSFPIRYVHPLLEQRWGQRVVRFYDPDGHILEVGEPLSVVIRRFLAQGMSPQQVAIRMDIPVEMVLSCQNHTPKAPSAIL